MPLCLIEVTLRRRELIDCGGVTYLFRAGQLLFIDCGAEHFPRTDPEASGWEKLWVCVC